MMTTRAHGPGSTVSGAKLGVYGGIATALITAIGSIIVAMMNHHDVVPVSNDKTMSAASNESTWTTITPTVSQGSDQGPVDRYAINDSRTEVKVWGHADKGVDGVFLLIGPKPSAGGYWLAFPTIFNQQWEADVPTEPKISPDFKIWAIPHTPGGARPMKFTFQNDPPMPPKPTPSPDPLMDCAAQHGPDCFTGPDWGPPSVYQPNQ
jgi:hypothetical protein